MLYLPPLTITAVVLPARQTWDLAWLVVARYSLLMILDSPVAHSDKVGHGNFVLHVLGMWLGFVFAAGLNAYFVGRMGDILREHEQALADTREQALRDENIVTQRTMAVGAAHELGTPLALVLAHATIARIGGFVE
jgi:two-component system sensor histidine kinase RegB